MQLSNLMRGIEYTGNVPACDVRFVTDDSRKVAAGCIFVCIQGEQHDGHDFAAQAIANGAVCVAAQRETGVQPQILVRDTREAYALLCANFFGNPADRLTLTAVTGTNGKTSIACLLKHIFDAAGYRTGLIGTMKNMVDQEDFAAQFTTPDPWELHELFKKMVDSGCTHCFMEASSQALAQQRCAGLRFRAAIYTNLTQDHLDYHKSFEAYFEAKRMLFFQSDCGIINCDDAYGLKMVEGSPARPITYSLHNNNANYTAKNVQLLPDSVSYELVSLGRIGRIRYRTPGAFSVYNSMAAACAALELGLSLEQIQDGIAGSPGAKGRMEVVPTGTPYTVVIDYAHTPDGLEKALTALRATVTGRVICVFGCGGDRDAGKRPLMGNIASHCADLVVVSSDNPRSEDPDAIIADILAGMKGKAQVLTEPNRSKAIMLAMKKAREGDTILLAGKGHEDYQILSTGKIHLDEREVVLDYLAGHKDKA